LKEKKIKILKCVNGHYTLDESCHVCGAKTFNPEPLKYSPEDKHGRERRKALYGV